MKKQSKLLSLIFLFSGLVSININSMEPRTLATDEEEKEEPTVVAATPPAPPSAADFMAAALRARAAKKDGKVDDDDVADQLRALALGDAKPKTGFTSATVVPDNPGSKEEEDTSARDAAYPGVLATLGSYLWGQAGNDDSDSD